MKIKAERKKLGARITALREEKGLTHEQLAEQAGMFVGELIRLENGRNNIKLNDLTALAQALGVTIELT
jgi:transcriptional regulator with XRE-family HTH domain